LIVGEIKAFAPPDVGIAEHIIRRLGWAVVRQWSSLPDDVQERIREQAVFTEDKYATVQLNEQIKAFLRKHAGTL
jgi:hypothetical protein